MKFILFVLVVGGIGYYAYKAKQDGKPVGHIIGVIISSLVALGIWGLKEDSDRRVGNQKIMPQIHQASGRDLMVRYDQLDNQRDHDMKIAIDQELQRRYGDNWRKMNF